MLNLTTIVALLIGIFGISIMCYAALIPQGNIRQKTITLTGSSVLTLCPLIEFSVNPSAGLFLANQVVAIAGSAIAFVPHWPRVGRLVVCFGIWLACTTLLWANGYLATFDAWMVSAGMGSLALGFSIGERKYYVIGGSSLAIGALYTFFVRFGFATGPVAALIWGVLNVVYTMFTIAGIHRKNILENKE